jgi:hypothetical protein
MFYLARAKRKIGEEIGSKALKASCNIVCGYCFIGWVGLNGVIRMVVDGCGGIAGFGLFRC